MLKIIYFTKFGHFKFFILNMYYLYISFLLLEKFSTLLFGYHFVICCVKSQMQNWSFKMYLCLSTSVSPIIGYPNGLLNVTMISVRRLLN